MNQQIIAKLLMYHDECDDTIYDTLGLTNDEKKYLDDCFLNNDDELIHISTPTDIEKYS